MAVRFEVSREVPAEVVTTVVPARPGEAVGYGIDQEYLRTCGFEGRADQVAFAPTATGGGATVVVGLGSEEAGDVAALRRAAACATRATSRCEAVAYRLLDALPEGAEPAERVAAAQAVAEGIVLGSYEFSRYRSGGDGSALQRAVVVASGGRRVHAAIELGARIGDGVTLARDLVNEPGGTLTPAALAEVAVEIAEREGLQVSVLEEDDLTERGMGGILAVNRGSAQPPRLIELSYEPDQPRGHLALVGKGITFDSGGLSIKTGASMMTMKNDMAGAAAILGALSVLPALAPRCRVTAYLPATDNMTGPDATRPGDVIRISNGTTVEVLNTDAEGRLVLADALALASTARPDAIVDLATLTGAAITALGDRIAGLFGNSEAWIDQVAGAAERAGERAWRMPLPSLYRPRLDSDVADLRNIGRANDGGAVIAGLFLQEFVAEGIPWAHLDIAGPAWSNEVEGELAKGGTGYGVRTLVELARTFQRPR